MQYSLFCLLCVMSTAKLTLQKGTSRVQWQLSSRDALGTAPLRMAWTRSTCGAACNAPRAGSR